MSKTWLAVVCAFLLSTGMANCADSTFPNPGDLYRAYFTTEFLNDHSMDPSGHYIVKIDAINKANPNWIQIEFPQAANQSYTSSLDGKRWINLNFVTELKPYTPPPGQ
jgi:hypothetical protein